MTVSPPPASPPPSSPNTKITKAEIDSAKGEATFKFKPLGEKATGFQCELKQKAPHKKARFRSCKSPKTYTHLKSGKYTFEVRAVGAGGEDPTPAKKRFKLRS